MRAAVITVSTSKAAGQGEDESGPLAAALAERIGCSVCGSEIVPDDRARIEERLRFWAGEGGAALVLTTGGTGFAPSDVTPEATAAVIERPAPGLAEAMRAESLKHTRYAVLTRAVCGIRGRTLIVNLPGSPKGVQEAFEAVSDTLPHALALLREEPTSHGR